MRFSKTHTVVRSGILLALLRGAEPFVAHAIKQLIFHLLVRKVVQALQNQNAHHRLGRVRRTPALRIHWTRSNPVDFGGQRRKINVRIHLGERVSQRVDLLTVMFVGKQVDLDGVTRFHRNGLQQDSERCNFTKWAVFSRCPDD
jgi:hypothetical protein